MKKTVYIIILNWNGWRDTLSCIESCHKQTYPNFNIIVVDNGSTDESIIKIREKQPKVEIIQTGANLGFAGGNNVGICHAISHGADYIWLLNNDTQVAPDALSELLKTSELDTNIGIVGSKIFTYSNPEILHFAGGKVDLQTGDTYHLGAWEKDVGQYDVQPAVDYLTGCSMLIKNAVIMKIGRMPEEYFLYYEETDWCMSAKKAGFSLRMAPKSKVFHKVSASVESISEAKMYYLFRNRLYFLQKYGNKPKWTYRFLTDLKYFFHSIFSGNFTKAKMIIKGYHHWIINRKGPLVKNKINSS